MFNCYLQLSLLVLQDGICEARFLHNRQVLTHGDPLAMGAHGIGIPLLIKHQKADFPDINQPWYADNSGALGTFTNTKLYFSFLNHFNPGHGYYPKPPNIIINLHLENIGSTKRFD